MGRKLIQKHFDTIADSYDKFKKKNHYYHRKIINFYNSNIPPGQFVLEVGCATGDVLNAVNPSCGLGIDLSSRLIEKAKKKYPHLEFSCLAAEDAHLLARKFDYIIVSNLFDYLEDIWPVLEGLYALLNPDGKLIVTSVNPVWESVFRVGQKLRLRTPDTLRNFITNKDIVNMLELKKFEIIKDGLSVFLPLYIPVISALLNFLIPELPMLRQMCVMQYIVAKKRRDKTVLSCSVVIPCHNEADNIEDCLRRIPKMGRFTEAIVVDDGSSDRTKELVSADLNRQIEIKMISYTQNRGKGYAVKTAFEHAAGDVLMILDADMAVMPEELPRFFCCIEDGTADFVNGTRVIYPMEDRSMSILKYFGNKIFSLILSWIMKQRVSDTLCGTKAVLKKDYARIQMEDASWGDFDLLFGAAKLNLKISEMPVHYKVRSKGSSKMRPFKHGLVLLEVCWRGFRELRLKAQVK